MRLSLGQPARECRHGNGVKGGFLLAMILLLGLALSACGAKADPLAERDAADMKGYAGLAEYDGDARYVSLTVKEICQMMDDGESFVLYAGYASCPWCNAMIAGLSQVAEEQGVTVGYLDTRADPSWESNMDIDDYDLFTKYFDDWIDKDDDGKKHLYVPEVYFIQKGKVIDHHDGVAEGLEDPKNELTDEQKKELHDQLTEGFKEALT